MDPTKPNIKSSGCAWQAARQPREREPNTSSSNASKKFKQIASKSAAMEAVAAAEAPTAVAETAPVAALLADPKDFIIAEELLSETCDKFYNRKKATEQHKMQMPALLRMLGLIGNVRIKDLKPSFIVNYIERGRQTITRYGRPYALESIWIQLCLISTVIKWRARMTDSVVQLFQVCDEYFLDQARSEGRDVRDGWRTERTRRLKEGEEGLIMDALAEMDEPCPRHWQLFFQFSLATGARQVELAQARWVQISPTGAIWHIPHHKTKARSQKLNDEAKAILAELKELASPDNDKLFHTIEDENKVCKTFRKVIDGLGLIDLRAHDFRHEGITRIVADSAEDIVVIMQWVGHSSPKMTARYTHLREHEIEKRLAQRAAKRLTADRTANGARLALPSAPPAFASPWAYAQAPSIYWSVAAQNNRPS